MISQVGEFQFKLDECDSVYESLLEAICYQSISGKAAQAIFARIKALGHERPLSHAAGTCCACARRSCAKPGFRTRKSPRCATWRRKRSTASCRRWTDAEKMSDQELVDRLISVRGIGAWTVEMFLIFRLGRPDVLPIHDYGVQKGFALTYRKKSIPKPKELLKFGERWRP